MVSLNVDAEGHAGRSESRIMQFAAYDRFISLVGDQHGKLGRPHSEEQNSEYESGCVEIDGDWWRIRTARVTPKKPGAFVAVWERDDSGVTRPFEQEEHIAGLMVFVCEGTRFGVFRFPAPLLKRLGVTRSTQHPGKRGFRVYPTWSENLNRQATRTQEAQGVAFVRLS